MDEELFETPVAFLIFDRPETTQRVFERIVQARPRRLFLIGDGPRPGASEAELQRIAAARRVAGQVEWGGAVETYFRDQNLGVRRGVTEGLNWLFEQVEEAIILEDDCLPHPTFFRFCQELLERYRADERVAMIGGTNYQFGGYRPPSSYFFTLYPHIWGWASWRRAWRQHDAEMRRWPEARQAGLLRSLLPDRRARRYWTRRFEMTYQGRIQTWDYPWTLSCWLENRLSIAPAVNLVSNIGFGQGAVHTFGRRSRLANMPVQAMDFPLIHPSSMIRDYEADRYTQRVVFRDHILAPLKRRIRLLLERFGVG